MQNCSVISPIIQGLLIVLGLAGCQPKATHSHDHEDSHTAHDHPHGPSTEISFAITVWENGYEIFAEHVPVVVGRGTRFITHVSDIKTGEPRREGLIKYVAHHEESGATFEHPQSRPAREGIYLPRITFPTAGIWQVQIHIPTDGNTAKVNLPPITVFANRTAASQTAPPDEPEGISFLKEQQWKFPTRTAEIGRRRLTEQLRLPAHVNAKPGSIAEITTPVSGRYTPPDGKTFPMVGDSVQAGQVMGSIHPMFSDAGIKVIEMQANLVITQNSLNQANQRFERTRTLAKAKAKSPRELEQVEFELKAAQANYEAAQALSSAYLQGVSDTHTNIETSIQPVISLIAPISGVIVSQSEIATGEFLTANRSLFKIINADKVFLEASVPETSSSRLGRDPGAGYSLPGQPARFFSITGENNGRLVWSGIQVDPDTRSFPLIYEIFNGDHRLKIGQMITLFVETNHAEDALAIPQSAIVEDEGQYAVFVQVSGETFQRRIVKLGIREEGWVQILSGVREGEHVTIDGAYAVRLASVSTSIPSHGHAH